MKRVLSFLVLVVFAWPLAHAHDVRPGYLEVTERSDGVLTIVFRQSALSAINAPLTPVFSTAWTQTDPVISKSGEAIVRAWKMEPPHAALAGTTVRIAGLETTITDVLLRVAYADGTELTHLLKPTDPELTLPNAAKVAPPVREYLQLGFTHIWSGVDHLLYVLGLVLLVRNRRLLFITITGFTIAHSITLAAAALGYVNVPTAPVEAVIALSLVYVAVELMHARRGRVGLAQRWPWLVAMSFGLLHGLGFAGALSDVGLPAHAIPQALLLFNMGIELGQLTFVALILLIGRTIVRLSPERARSLQWLPPYAIGSLACFWVIERIHVFL